LEVFDRFSEGEEMISGGGIPGLSMEFGATGPEDPILSCIAWKLRSEDMWVFRKTERFAMWARERAYNLEEMKKATHNWIEDLKTDRVFVNFYSWIFEYLKPVGASVISGETAIQAWKITGIDKKWGWFDPWTQWLQGAKKSVDKDTWKMMPSFIKKIGTDLSQDDELEIWPPHYDDFITWMKRRK